MDAFRFVDPHKSKKTVPASQRRRGSLAPCDRGQIGYCISKRNVTLFCKIPFLIGGMETSANTVVRVIGGQELTAKQLQEFKEASWPSCAESNQN